MQTRGVFEGPDENLYEAATREGERDLWTYRRCDEPVSRDKDVCQSELEGTSKDCDVGIGDCKREREATSEDCDAGGDRTKLIGVKRGDEVKEDHHDEPEE